MKRTLLNIAMIAIVILLVVGSIYYEAQVWNECRQTNSFFYCWRILS